MSSSSKKGSRDERELSDLLEDEYGFAAYRAPASGGATQRARPDIIATRDCGEFSILLAEGFAIEHKSRKDGTVTFTRDEIDALVEFADRGGLTPLVTVKPDMRSHDQWYCFDARLLNRTAKGYSVRKQDHERAKTLGEVFGQ
ncbi:holliday junction resolvase [Haladaptatus litoreus]|uniref:Holliday junction resolvase n=1 Tax=Haladaptatus litoreus TaxID=553468 RepID=A0A1N7FI85_9EURY|nr:hypothetical protein [Haladaptatus litoreus]SIS00033.1 holliday junction resolvase [Haladaptatus litoreus]